MIVSLEGLKKTASSLLNVRKAYVHVCKMTNQQLNRRKPFDKPAPKISKISKFTKIFIEQG